MLTNPSTSSTSVSSSSLVEASSLSSPSSTAAATSVGNATPSLQNSTKPKTPAKRRKKDNTDVELVVPIAVESSSAVVNDNSKKRSRKQKIDTFRNEYDLPILEGLSASDKSAKRKKGRRKSTGDNNVSNSLVKKEGNDVKKNIATKTKGRNASAPPELSKKSKKGTNKTSTTTAAPPDDNSVVSYGPQSKIVLKKSEFIDPNLSFTIFPDLSRGLGAIGPSQVILAVESTREPGTQAAFFKDLSESDSKASKKPIVGQFQLFDLLLSVPHFLPLTSVYSAGEPFARILRYSALEQFTNGVQRKNQVSTFRFYGPRYEKQVPALPASQEKAVSITTARNPNAYLDSVLIIKHPILGFYSRKLVSLKFVVLKKVPLESCVVGHLKAKVVQLRRSADLKNIEIYVDESRVPEAASDVSAMNQQNIQPVIQTPSGLVPVITRTAYQPQQEYHIQPQQELAETQFQYVQYQYQTATELTEVNSNSVGGSNNYILSLDNAGLLFDGSQTFRDESGAQVLILSPSGDDLSSNYVQQHHQPAQQQQIVHQLQDHGSFYPGQEQSVIIQQHPQQQSSQLQQQQTYTIQQQQAQQHQQLIQIQPPHQTKELRQLLYLPGSNCPIEVQFIPEPNQQEDPNRHYNQSQQIQLQVQAPQQYRPGQQLVVQQNQFQIQQQQQAIQQHVINSQGQVVRQQQFLPQNNTSVVASTQSCQYRPTAQQQQIVHHTSQQQHHQIQTPVSNQSVAVQQSHQVHTGNQVSTIQALPSSSQQVRFQSVQQQGHTQQLQQAQLVQQVSRSQLIQQQVVSVPQAQLSPLKVTPPAPQVPVYQQQRPQYQQQVQQQVPQGGTPYTPPATTTAPQSTVPINTTTPSKQKGTKTKQPKGSPKKSTKSGNLNQTSTNLDDQYLSPQQLEQLRQRETKGLTYQPQQATPTPPVPSQQSFPTVAPSHPAPAQGGAGARLPSPSVRPKGRGPRPPAPPPPIISSTAASLGRLPSVSSGTSARLPVAPNSHTPSTTSSALCPVSKGVKKFYVVNPNNNATSSTTTSSGAATAVTSHVPLTKTKPGYLAVCPHCGVGNTNIVRCQRCKLEFPADVKLIQDEWKVNRAGAVVAVAAKTSSPRTTTPSPPTTSDNNKNNKVPAASSSTANSASSKAPAKTSAAGKKILLVNKPNILESSAVIGKTVVTPGTVQVRIQPDGGSAVTITNSGTSVVQTKINTPVTVSKTAVRKRPTQKKKLECITLSSDDEEPEPKVPKQDDKSSVSPTTASNTSASSTTTTTTAAATTASTTTSAATSVTSSITSSSTSTPGGIQSQTGKSNQLPSDKKDVVEVVSSTTTPPATIAMPQKKGLQINLTPKKDQPLQKEETALDPAEVYEKIDSEMAEVGNKFQFTQLECRSIRVGSYKVTGSDVGHSIAVQLTELGFKLTLPCANFKRRIAKICIPIDSIINMKACFNKRLLAFFITTGPKYAAWIRQTLGMDGTAGNESSNFYCPLNGLPCQRTITILGEDIGEADVGIIRKMFKDVLHELELPQANEFLMKIAPMSYKCSIGINPDNSPPEAAGSPPDRRMTIPSAPGSTLSTISQATTVVVNSPHAKSTPTISSSAGSSSNADQDPDKVVLSYEGPNSNKVAISPNDIKGLGYSQFLNDQIIDFWLAVIQMEMLSAEDKQKTFVFDSFFYKKLTEKIKRRNEEDGNMTAGERRHARVKKRTKNVDIFSKDFLIVPINENYHWFIAIICFPGLEGFHDYNSLEPLPNYKRPRTSNNSNKSSGSNNNKKPIVYNQPKSETSSYSSRDEAPEDSEEMDQMSSPDTPGTDGSEPKSQGKTESGGESSNEKSSNPSGGVKRKSEFGQAVKHPCILIFDSLAGDARGKIYSTLREYLRIEYKTKKNAERTFDKNAMPGIMPKVPQQPNFSDCGLFLLQYVESFFSKPIPNYDPKDINLKNWFTPASIAENKRREIYDFILNKVREKSPQNECRIPAVSFEPDENDLMNEEEMFYRNNPDYEEDSDDEFETEDDSDEELFTPSISRQPSNNRQPSSSSSSSNKKGSDSDDHNYATTPPKPGSTNAVQVANASSVVVTITPLPATSDTTLNKNT